ncbi:MAG: helix-turn-helix transcriptional regulator [Treponema sp.]|nr:helix-turn-helix transcriptional regulator [Treponema sp.]
MSKENDDISDADLSLRKILSQNIRIFRKNLHLTQERLAENADISLPYLSDIEHCKTWVSDKTLLKLSKALNTTPSELLNENIPPVEIHLKENLIADLLLEQKKQISKAVSDICDETFSKLLEL